MCVLAGVWARLCVCERDGGSGEAHEARRRPLSDYLRALFADLYRPTTSPSIICPVFFSLFWRPSVPPHHSWANITLSQAGGVCVHVCVWRYVLKKKVIKSMRVHAGKFSFFFRMIFHLWISVKTLPLIN